MYAFNIILTEFCNANCSHCYMADGTNKKKRTLTKEEIDIIINKLPDTASSITLTGGEIFLVNDLLEYAIKKIKTKIPNVKLELESNGIYLYKNNALEILKYLKILGVDSIRFSIDIFHQQGGVDLKKVEELKKLENIDTPVIRYLIQEKALGIGKAKELDDNLLTSMNCMNNKNTVNRPYFFLDINGDVYLCAWKCIPAIGNIFKDSFDDILKRLELPFFKNILVGNIKEAIDSISDKDNQELIDKYGECYLCNKTFKEDNHVKVYYNGSSL